MDDKLLCGIALGMVGGALLATHSQKTREVIKDGEQQLKEKVDNLKKPAKKSK